MAVLVSVCVLLWLCSNHSQVKPYLHSCPRDNTLLRVLIAFIASSGIGPDDQSTRLGDVWLLDLTEFSAPDPMAPRNLQNAVAPENAEGGEEDEMSPMHQQLNSVQPTRNGDFPPEGPDSFVASPSAALAASNERTKMDQQRPIWIRPRTEVQGGPSPRSHTSVVSHKNKVWIFGGYGGDRQARMHLGDLICLHAHDERAKLWAQVYVCALLDYAAASLFLHIRAGFMRSLHKRGSSGRNSRQICRCTSLAVHKHYLPNPTTHRTDI